MARRWWLLVAAFLAVASAAPASELTFPAGLNRVRLPARINANRIIVRVDIAGRGLDLYLDTGSSRLVLDRSIASQLAHQGTADAVQALGGAVDAQRVMLPKASIGTLQLLDTVALAVPFAITDDLHTRVVGLLGDDFAAHCVLRIDYARGTVDAIRPAGFQPPAGAQTVPLQFDNGVPLVPLVVNGVESTRFVLDTGADMLTLFPWFEGLRAAPARDAGRGSKATRTAAESVRAAGAGGTEASYPVTVADARFGGESFAQMRAIVVPHMPLRLNGGDLDGLVGNALLRRFVVYLDYARARLYLEPTSSP